MAPFDRCSGCRAGPCRGQALRAEWKFEDADEIMTKLREKGVFVSDDTLTWSAGKLSRAFALMKCPTLPKKIRHPLPLFGVSKGGCRYLVVGCQWRVAYCAVGSFSHKW